MSMPHNGLEYVDWVHHKSLGSSVPGNRRNAHDLQWVKEGEYSRPRFLWLPNYHHSPMQFYLFCD